MHFNLTLSKKNNLFTAWIKQSYVNIFLHTRCFYGENYSHFCTKGKYCRCAQFNKCWPQTFLCFSFDIVHCIVYCGILETNISKLCF